MPPILLRQCNDIACLTDITKNYKQLIPKHASVELQKALELYISGRSMEVITLHTL